MGIIDNILAKKAIDVGLDQFFKNLIKNLIKNFNQNPIEKVDQFFKNLIKKFNQNLIEKSTTTKKSRKNFNFIRNSILIFVESQIVFLQIDITFII